MDTKELRDEYRRYLELIHRAEAAGVITDLTDPLSPRTIDELEAATEAREEWNHFLKREVRA